MNTAQAVNAPNDGYLEDDHVWASGWQRLLAAVIAHKPEENAHADSEGGLHIAL